MRERPIKKHPLVSSASHNGVLLCTTCVYLVSLDYEISLPHPSPYHTSQQAADLVFEPTMNRSQKREKSNIERNFLAKNSKRDKLLYKVNFTYVRLCKNNVGKKVIKFKKKMKQVKQKDLVSVHKFFWFCVCAQVTGTTS